MMQCSKCRSTDGPFIVEVDSRRCLCEDCYMYEEIVKKTVLLIKLRSNKDNLSMKAVATMDSIETAVFDELEIR